MSDQPEPLDLLNVETPESVAFAYRLAGLGSRGFALILDAVIIGGIGAVEALVAVGIYFAVAAASPRLATTLAPWIVGATLVVVLVTVWGYFIVGEVFGNGRTWGKRWMGLRVVRDDGSRIRAGD